MYWMIPSIVAGMSSKIFARTWVSGAALSCIDELLLFLNFFFPDWLSLSSLFSLSDSESFKSTAALILLQLLFLFPLDPRKSYIVLGIESCVMLSWYATFLCLLLSLLTRILFIIISVWPWSDSTSYKSITRLAHVLPAVVPCPNKIALSAA